MTVRDLMYMKEFYEKYGLSVYEFCTMLGISDKTLAKYLNGEKIKESTVRKIETGIRIVKGFDLVRPKRSDYPSSYAHNVAVRKYRNDFKERLKEEV